VKELGAADRTGTRIHFFPDAVIFGETKFNYDSLQERLRELAFLNRGLAIHVVDERTGQKDSFLSEGGVAEYVAWLNQAEQTLHQPIYVRKQIDAMLVEVALQYNQNDEERIRCYANNAYNPNGGTHLSGFRAGLTRTLNAYGEKENLFDKIKPEGQDFRKGLTAVINITLPNPQFEAQTKVRLNNPEVEGAVQSSINEVLSKYLEENPKESKKILQRVLFSAEEREAEAKARKALRERKNILSGGGLPGKLMDCTTKDRDSSEVFLVEGDSAGGSAESGRDRLFQAVLPLRGKPLNVQKARTEQMLKNDEIISIIAAMGTDIGNPDDISKLRYGKIVILTDADVDGQHIRTLLLTFFFRQMRKLIEEGHIYVARPPLFKVVHKKSVRFIATLDEMNDELFQRGLDETKLILQGANPQTLERDALQNLVQLMDRLESGLVTLERRGVNLVTFVPHATKDGFPAWHVKFKGKEFWFTSSEEVDTFRKEESKRLGREIVIGDEEAQNQKENEEHFLVDEFHEIRRTINPALKELAKYHFGPADLIPAPRLAGREPPVRYVLEHDESRRNLATLRELVGEVRHFGEKGMTITRFKGLGEMDPEELWDTTLDPTKRTLLQVKLDDAQRANDLFTMLMGDEVEGRKNFIFEKGINVKDQIDYGS
jgi:DNA gyrase subunit B